MDTPILLILLYLLSNASSSKSLDNNAYDTKSLNTRPLDTKPFSNEPFNTKPFETKPSDNKSSDTLHNIKDFLSNMQIDSNYTENKIKIAKKVGPLLPSEYGIPFNKSILITERVVRLMDALQFVNQSEVVPLEVLDLQPKERVQKIVSTIQDEVQSSKIDNLGMILDLVINMDKYKKMFNTFASLINTKKPLSDTNSLMKIVDTLMEGSSDADKEKINEMSKMLDVLKILDMPKKEKPNE